VLGHVADHPAFACVANLPLVDENVGRDRGCWSRAGGTSDRVEAGSGGGVDTHILETDHISTAIAVDVGEHSGRLIAGRPTARACVRTEHLHRQPAVCEAAAGTQCHERTCLAESNEIG